MNRDSIKYIVVGAAIVIIFAGLLMTFQTIHRIREVSEKLTVRMSQIEAVENMRSEIAEFNAVLKLYEDTPDCRLKPVSAAIREAFPGFRTDTIKDFKREAIPGWVFHEKEISFGDVDIAEVIGVLHKLELQRPPWRLAKCLIKAASKQAGKGRVIVTLEGIERD